MILLQTYEDNISYLTRFRDVRKTKMWFLKNELSKNVF